MDNVREIRTKLKNIMHCYVISMYDICILFKAKFLKKSKIMNFCKRSYQPILRYLYTETIKRGGEISLHKHFNSQ